MRSRHLTNGTFILLIGVYFLLRNLGIISSISWSSIFSLWPLLLIIIGIQIIFPRGLLSLLAPLLLIASFIILIFGPTLPFGIDGELIHGEFPFDDKIHTATLVLDSVPVAELDLYANTDPLAPAISFSGNDSVIESWDFNRQTQSYIFAGADKTIPFFSLGQSYQLDPFTLNLNPNIDWDFQLNITVAAGIIDLSSLTWKSLTIDSGVSHLTIKTGAALHNSAEIIFESGISKLTLQIPRNLAVRITPSEPEFLNRLTTDGLKKSGKRFITPNFGDSDTKTLDIVIKAGISHVNIEWVDVT